MIATQMSIFHRAVNLLLDLPLMEDGEVVPWMFVCTSEDGEGENPTYGSLTLVPPRALLNETLATLGANDWELVPVPDGNPLHVRTSGNLEITVVEEL